MALTYATIGAIVKASEQSRKPVPVVLSGESIPSWVTPVNGATVHRVTSYLAYNRFAVSVRSSRCMCLIAFGTWMSLRKIDAPAEAV